MNYLRRRDFMLTGATGLAGAALAAMGCSRGQENQNTGPLGSLRSATPADLRGWSEMGVGSEFC